MPLLGPLTSARAYAATRRDLRFRALWRGSSIGEHRVAFGTDGDRLVVDTHVDIAVRVLFFNVFRLTHDAQEIWQSGRLVSVTSTTDRDGTRASRFPATLSRTAFASSARTALSSRPRTF
jgi:hypothetical protein